MKILVIQPRLLHYRFSFYERLAARLEAEIIVAHSGPVALSHGLKGVSEIVLKEYRFLSFRYQRALREMFEGVDLVILPFDPHYISFYYPFFRKRLRFLYFGIGLGRSPIANFIRRSAAKRTDALLYSAESFVEFYTSLDFSAQDRLSFFVNSIDVHPIVEASDFKDRKYFLFVGSLEPRKRLPDVLLAFHQFCKFRDDINLVIVGEGPESERLVNLVSNLGIQSRVEFRGFISDRGELSCIYKGSLATLHFGQAGLSVLQSLGHGVPCIISRDAISGGEKYCVIDGYNGFVVNDYINDFSAAMYRLSSDEKIWKPLSDNSRKYYVNNCSIDAMVRVFEAKVREVVSR